MRTGTEQQLASCNKQQYTSVHALAHYGFFL